MDSLPVRRATKMKDLWLESVYSQKYFKLTREERRYILSNKNAVINFYRQHYRGTIDGSRKYEQYVAMYGDMIGLYKILMSSTDHTESCIYFFTFRFNSNIISEEHIRIITDDDMYTVYFSTPDSILFEIIQRMIFIGGIRQNITIETLQEILEIIREFRPIGPNKDKMRELILAYNQQKRLYPNSSYSSLEERNLFRLVDSYLPIDRFEEEKKE